MGSRLLIGSLGIMVGLGCTLGPLSKDWVVVVGVLGVSAGVTVEEDVAEAGVVISANNTDSLVDCSKEPATGAMVLATAKVGSPMHTQSNGSIINAKARQLMALCL